MLKKMRRRFVGAAMAAFFAVVMTLLCVVNVWYYRSVAAQQDETLQLLLESEQRFSPAMGAPPFASMDRFSAEVPYMIRFFSVHYDAQGALVRVNRTYIASVTPAEALRCAEEVAAGGRERGYYGAYRYLLSREGGGTSVLFLNSERELEAARSLLWSTLAIAGISLAALFVLVLLFSGRAIAPYMRNLEAQKQFITNAGHELKTPITAISASAEVLAMEQPDDEWVRSIRTQTARLSRLVTGLVTLSRLNEEDPFPTRAAFSLSDALWEISEPFVSLARAKGRHFTQDIADGLSLVGDCAAVQQMASILLDNAVKYSAEGGSIRLSAKRSGRRTEITVENDVDPAQRIDTARLFDRFYRADESHSGRIGGTGIGLSIAKATAEAHGGTITARQDGGVIRFCVRL